MKEKVLYECRLDGLSPLKVPRTTNTFPRLIIPYLFPRLIIPYLYKIILKETYFDIKVLYFTIKKVEYKKVKNIHYNALGSNEVVLEISYKKNSKDKNISLILIGGLGGDIKMTNIFNVLKSKTNVFKEFKKNKNPSIYKQNKREKFQGWFGLTLIVVFIILGSIWQFELLKPYKNWFFLFSILLPTIMVIWYIKNRDYIRNM